MDHETFLQGDRSSNEIGVWQIENLIAQSNEAKENKNYVVANELRNRLQEHGMLLKDTPECTIWRRV